MGSSGFATNQSSVSWQKPGRSYSSDPMDYALAMGPPTASQIADEATDILPFAGSYKMMDEGIRSGNYWQFTEGVGWVAFDMFGGSLIKAASKVVVKMAGALAARWAFGAAKAGTTVLGKYPDYINLASEINAKRFSIPTNIWNKMSPAEQWNANVKFLDRAIARGDNILLSNPVTDLNMVSGYFRKELEYLISKGYKLSRNGTQLIK